VKELGVFKRGKAEETSPGSKNGEKKVGKLPSGAHQGKATCRRNEDHSWYQNAKKRGKTQPKSLKNAWKKT